MDIQTNDDGGEQTPANMQPARPRDLRRKDQNNRMLAFPRRFHSFLSCWFEPCRLERRSDDAKSIAVPFDPEWENYARLAEMILRVRFV